MTTGVYFTPCGHGHVVPNPDGSRADCGGPTSCLTCATEQDKINKGELPNVGQPQAQPEEDILDELYRDGLPCEHRGLALQTVLQLYAIQAQGQGPKPAMMAGSQQHQHTIEALLNDARRVTDFLDGLD